MDKNTTIRTPEELLLIMKAEAMGDIAFEHMLDFIKPGMTEIQIADEIERVLRALGAEGLSFETIAVSGVNSNQPHGVPSEKKIEEGEFLTMDLGALYKGYCGDMTRTVAIGYATDEMKEIYDIVLRSQLAGLKGRRELPRCGQGFKKHNRRSRLRRFLYPRYWPRSRQRSTPASYSQCQKRGDLAGKSGRDGRARNLSARKVRSAHRRLGNRNEFWYNKLY